MPQPDDSRPTVSLVIPVRNEGAHIEACLGAIGGQDYPADRIEVLVVDGESTDDTAALVAKIGQADPRVRLLANPQRIMPAGLNVGIEAASGEYVGVVSGHSALPPDYVSRAVAAMETSGAWSVGGRIMRRAHGPMQAAIALATSSRVGVGDSLHNYAARAGWVETVFPGFWRRELFEHIGLFDPAMVANEDNELSLRIHEAGGKIWYDPAIRVDYLPRSSLGALFRQYRRYGLGKMRVLRKHRGGLRWRHVVPALWVAFLVLGAIASILAPAFAPIYLLGIGIYLATVIVAAVRLARRDVSWWRIAMALATIHLGYGIGSWQGLATWGARGPRS